MGGGHSGYYCRICKRYVRDATESELYLRYVLGEIDREELRNAQDAHICCVPEIAQYIVDDDFDPASSRGTGADKSKLDPDRVAKREARVTKAWRKLQTVPEAELDVADDPST